jgi:hypothetical protein
MSNPQNLNLDPDAYKSFAELTADQGLQFEDHLVVTEDGYILSVFHIWKKKKRGPPPVFFQHGLFSSADTWILSQDLSPAFRAA